MASDLQVEGDPLVKAENDAYGEDVDDASPVSGPAKRNRSSGGQPKRKKVSHACVYCRRSHMTCDDTRPCQRCIKRNIPHLCHDEPSSSPSLTGHSSLTASPTLVDSTALAALAKLSVGQPGKVVRIPSSNGQVATVNGPLIQMAPGVYGAVGVLAPAGTGNGASSTSALSGASAAPKLEPNSSSTTSPGGLLGDTTGGSRSSLSGKLTQHLAGDSKALVGNSASSLHNGGISDQRSATQTSGFLTEPTPAPLHIPSPQSAASAFASLLSSAPTDTALPTTDLSSLVSLPNATSGFDQVSHLTSFTPPPNPSTLLTTLDLLGSLQTFPNLFASAHSGEEFSIITEFLNSLDASGQFIDPAALTGVEGGDTGSNDDAAAMEAFEAAAVAAAGLPPTDRSLVQMPSFALPRNPTPPNPGRPFISQAERFILTAADPDDSDSPEDRLTRVIHAKFEAGLLKPYNYHAGYVRLQRYMDRHMTPPARQRILSVIGTIRPAFRSVAQSLTDLDLVLVEEQFERLLLEYDRVFSSMGIPACLWRRTGEICKTNREFAKLVGLPLEKLSDGRTSIYELLQEDSAVNYWEKYGNIAFDEGQKAVLTSCVLRSPPADDSGGSGASGTAAAPGLSATDATSSGRRKIVSCCFSFTIRRDRYNIPILIVGNFLPYT
ncbi:hypothetical protein M427DRAFT_53369 [Gonapodya prolifera JEL478]|uniref:Zn(2)-C6 fungal-type domain-containing protein n=1 Tax=Gonapodya prolifera (strain JEL478) TaxID=1344416 RepID=A0A139AQ56_GONPJ|nr:hypothetical protein M427DRAFT_53369 [Gonapodya prolifera JEL478]|eukprot:KXS18887.1 hypothetical protein M427DRAFT_53369 [Gonapodya prolifera JEL478]